jgi:hypothetical protein
MEKGQRALAAQLWSNEKRKEMAEGNPDLAWLFGGKKERGAQRTQKRQEQKATAGMGGWISRRMMRNERSKKS